VAYGTGGTTLGLSRYLKEHLPSTKTRVCEPDNAPMLYSEIKTEYPEDGDPSTSFKVAHPIWCPHLLQGWATDFIPKLLSKGVDAGIYDFIENVAGNDAMESSRELAKKEGIFLFNGKT
jgi:cysteine synthase A